MDIGAVVSLIGSMGSSGAAVFVMWFLTNSFTRTMAADRLSFTQIIAQMDQRLYDLAKDKGDVIRSNAVAMERLTDAVDALRLMIEPHGDRQVRAAEAKK